MTDETWRVELTGRDLLIAAQAGIIRQIESFRRGYQARATQAPTEGWSNNIEGALGEWALAKAIDRFPHGFSGEANTDVGRRFEVRTRSQHRYELIVREGDSDDSRYVLVTGACGSYWLRGWLLGRDAKREEWLADHGGRGTAYFVPTEALRRMDELLADTEGL